MKNDILFSIAALGAISALAFFIFPFLIGSPFVLFSTNNILGLTSLMVTFFAHLFDVILYTPDIRKMIDNDIEKKGLRDPDAK